MKRGLILINMQNDFFEEGNMELKGMDEVAQNAKVLIEKFRQYQLDVFHVQHVNKKRDAKFFLPNTSGVMIHKNVEPKNAEKVVQKQYPNSFKDTNLLSLIQARTIDHLVFCGAMAHLSIDSSVRAASDFGYKCTVIDDACASRDLNYRGEIIKSKDVHNTYMASLKDSYAEILSLEEFLRI